MDEGGWLRSEDPQAMLTFLRGHEANLAEGIGGGRYVLSDRNLRLFACALWRRRWGRKGVDDRALTACAAAEAFADGLLDGPGLCRAYDECWLPMHPPEDRRQSRLLCSAMAREAASALLLGASPIDQPMDEAGAAKLLREIIGNPFRSAVVLPRDIDTVLRVGPRNYRQENVALNDWLTPDVRRLAQIAYDGDLTAYLPLADALEEQGCPDGDLLRHLRGQEVCPQCLGSLHYYNPIASQKLQQCTLCWDDKAGVYGWPTGWIVLRSPHVKGCWAVSLLLGKEGLA